MLIYGLQKMTLLDYPEHVACTVFLSGCDMRCPFCHNFELVDGTAPAVMTDDEFFAFLDKRHGLLDAVAITGGEPCVTRELPAFIRKIREKGFGVKLDTNGLHPDMVRGLLDEHLVDYIAMDNKNSPDKYAETAGVLHVNLDVIRETIDLLRNSGIDYEFRTTVVKEFHDEEDFPKMAKMIEGAKHYYLQQFTDRDTVPFEGFHAHSAEDMKRFAELARPYVQDVQLRGVE